MRKILSLVTLLLIGVTLSGCTQPTDSTDPIDPTDPVDPVVVDFESEYPEYDTYYQVFVRSFADSDNDGVGDFKGIEENLDYFVDLGIDALWLMPIHPSPTYHGYDVLDFYDVNSDYGTMEDFESMVQKADELGIDIILDWVINHVSIQHEWFTEWMAGNSEYENFFRSINSSDPRFDLNPSYWNPMGVNEYYAGYFYQMADLNWSIVEVQEEMISAALFWLDKGVDGFRLDAAKYLEAYGEVNVQTQSITSTLNKLALFEYRLEEYYPDVYITGEVWSGWNEMKLYYQSMDSVLNFDIGGSIVNAVNSGNSGSYVDMIFQQLEDMDEYDNDAIYAPFLYNHDQDRLATILNGNVTKLKLAAEMLLTIEGNPTLYYGEELGMFGYKSAGPTIWDETRRMPVIWGNEYTTSWYTDSSIQSVDSVINQQADPDSIYNVYKNMLHVRQDNIALRYGETEVSEYASNILMSYYRTFYHDEDNFQKVLVIHNISEHDYPLNAINGGSVLYYSEGLNNYSGTVASQTTVIIEVPYEAANE